MENNIFKQVGNNIQSILNENNKSQQYLADKLNVSKQVMSKIILGAKAINVAEITQIATALNVTVDNLLKVNQENNMCHKFAFMGQVKNEKTKERIDFLKNVIDEILILEEYADGK